MSQFMVRLRGEASDALGELALRERRRHQEQAAVVLERALLRWRAAQRARPRRRLHALAERAPPAQALEDSTPQAAGGAPARRLVSRQ